jgi:tRNA A37 threonylcarbamoyladenosine modification protein TsaB
LKTLFLDTAYNQVVGLLDEDANWLGRQTSQGQKSSAKLHLQLHELCQQHGVKAADIRTVIYVSGPGFYTGLRVGYGVAETLSLGGVEALGVYAHEVPRLLGELDYAWVTKAYRGEIFVHTCQSGVGVSHLVSEDLFSVESLGARVYIHSIAALDEKLVALGASLKTEELIQVNIRRLLPHWRETGTKSLFYFRGAEEEFRPNP